MGVLGRYGSSALKYWGNILNSAYKGDSTADMWVAIHAQADTYGFASPQTQPPDASVLRGFANRIVAGARAFAAASPTDTITADMMAIAPYTANDRNTIATTPTYHVRFQNTIQADDGTTTEVWNTSVFTVTDFPSTVGGLLDAIDTDATEIAAQGGASDSNTPRGVSLGVGQIEITLV
jgi:hypothetical protein